VSPFPGWLASMQYAVGFRRLGHGVTTSNLVPRAIHPIRKTRVKHFGIAISYWPRSPKCSAQQSVGLTLEAMGQAWFGLTEIRWKNYWAHHADVFQLTGSTACKEKSRVRAALVVCTYPVCPRVGSPRVTKTVLLLARRMICRGTFD